MDRIIAGSVGLLFGSVGFLMLCFIWLLMGDFGPISIFVKLFATLFALPFALLGARIFYIAITGKSLIDQQMHRANEFFQKAKALGKESNGNETGPRVIPIVATKACPHCGAPIGEAEISPSGDVKCVHCRNWFNVR